ncbi:MAG: hypothetical protein F4Z76_06225 [Rhodothermaceae bacterium]|nr:hypothetical protein [Rhodothermaceae bacterium]
MAVVGVVDIAEPHLKMDLNVGVLRAAPGDGGHGPSAVRRHRVVGRQQARANTVARVAALRR